MVELEFSGLLSMWERSSVMAAPGALWAALYDETACIRTFLPRRMSPALETRVEKWRTISLQPGSWYDRKYTEEKRGEELRFDRENVHHP
jgi:hypothetical protein